MKKNIRRIISTSLIVMMILGMMSPSSMASTYYAAETSSSEEGWIYVSTLPTGVNATSYEIQYQNVYEQHGASLPGEGWTDTGIDNEIYVKSGSAYESDSPLATSDTVWLEHYYYYHFCDKSMGTSVSCKETDSYVHLDEIRDVSSVYEYASYTDEENDQPTYYQLRWTNGSKAYCYRNAEEGTCDGTDGQHGTRACHWYKKYVYQNYQLETLNLYQKISEWGTVKDSLATTVNIRYRLKAESITLNHTAVTLDAIGETVALTATVNPSNVADKAVTWESSNTAVVTVNENGVVTAVGKV